jgi:carboxyl-terminal processing protease
MRKTPDLRKTSLIIVSALCGAAIALIVTERGPAPAAAEAKTTSTARVSADTIRRMALFTEVLDRVRADYVEKPDDTKLIEAAIGGMLSSLDPHSEYMNAKAFADVQVQTHGEFGGVGIRVVTEDGFIKVLAPIDRTPAARAGILADDVITHLDGQPLKGMTIAEVAGRMRGPVGTTARLTIARKGAAKPLQFAIVRDTIRLPSVTFHREDGDIGYIGIARFNYQTTDGLKEAIRELSRDGGVSGYILDLRNNPGGLIDQAVAVTGSFLDKGEIVSLRGRDPDQVERFDARSGRGDLTGGKRLVVLINGGSASSSEIVAGALQDHKRAVILGTRSYGKGSVQTIIPLGDGNGGLRLTSARYFTPAGRSIQAQGIVPDIEVMQSPPQPLQNAAYEPHSEATLRGHLKSDGEEHAGSQSFVPPDPADDKALQKALDLLRGSRVDAAKALPRTPVTSN